MAVAILLSFPALYALWRNPEDLTARQERKLAWIAKVNTTLYGPT